MIVPIAAAPIFQDHCLSFLASLRNRACFLQKKIEHQLIANDIDGSELFQLPESTG